MQTGQTSVWASTETSTHSFLRAVALPPSCVQAREGWWGQMRGGGGGGDREQSPPKTSIRARFRG